MAFNENYVYIQDKKKIECCVDEISNNTNLPVAITFRAAGSSTIARLQEGAGAKLHKILDKTIKESTYDLAHDGYIKMFCDMFHSTQADLSNKLKGLVGVWDHGKIKGLYLTFIGELEFLLMDASKVGYKQDFPGWSIPYLKLGNQAEIDFLMNYYAAMRENMATVTPPDKEHIADYYFARCFFAGDYDLHDVFVNNQAVALGEDEILLSILQHDLFEDRYRQLQERYGINVKVLENRPGLTERYGADLVAMVESRMRDEKQAYRRYQNMNVEDLPDAVNAGTFVEEDYRRVQHGPQHLYVQQMIAENEKFCNNIDQIFHQISALNAGQAQVISMRETRAMYKKIANRLVEKVAMYDLPVLLCGDARRNPRWDMLNDFRQYNAMGLITNPDWSDRIFIRDGRLIEFVTSVLQQYARVVVRTTAYMRGSAQFLNDMENELQVEAGEMVNIFNSVQMDAVTRNLFIEHIVNDVISDYRQITSG